jgi:hypothetical protein
LALFDPLNWIVSDWFLAVRAPPVSTRHRLIKRHSVEPVVVRLMVFKHLTLRITNAGREALEKSPHERTRAKVERRRAQLEESVARYLSQLDTADRQEPTEALGVKVTRLKEKRACGLDDDDLHKPRIGIVSTQGENTPCSMSLAPQADSARIGVAAGGGMPVPFTTISVSDGISMNHKGMRLSLVSREIAKPCSGALMRTRTPCVSAARRSNIRSAR